MKEIVQDGNPILREKATEVAIKNITSDETKSLINDMFKALAEKENGVALAAPQIGVSVRIFVVSDKVFKSEDEEDKNITDNLVYINPKITKTSKKFVELDEACLSVDGYSGLVNRAQQVTVEAYDENGKKFTRGASGLLAQIFQHEIDHLEGVLYTDHATDVRCLEHLKEN